MSRGSHGRFGLQSPELHEPQKPPFGAAFRRRSSSQTLNWLLVVTEMPATAFEGIREVCRCLAGNRDVVVLESAMPIPKTSCVTQSRFLGAWLSCLAQWLDSSACGNMWLVSNVPAAYGGGHDLSARHALALLCCAACRSIIDELNCAAANPTTP